MHKPKASFIIPVRNGRAYLAETIESCLAQTQKKFEVIVVDDGSTDTTKRIIDYYTMKDPRVKGLFLPANRGRSAARNAGIDVSTSNILLMQDADDLAEPRRLADTLKAFGKNPGADIVYGEFHVISSLGVLIGSQGVEPVDPKKVKETGFFFIGHSTMAFRRRVWEKCPYTEGDVSSLGIDDWKFQFDAMKAGFQFLPVKRIWMKYRFEPKERNEDKIREIKKEWLDSV